jgi:hypothetical protein
MAAHAFKYLTRCLQCISSPNINIQKKIEHKSPLARTSIVNVGGLVLCVGDYCISRDVTSAAFSDSHEVVVQSWQSGAKIKTSTQSNIHQPAADGSLAARVCRQKHQIHQSCLSLTSPKCPLVTCVEISFCITSCMRVWPGMDFTSIQTILGYKK